MFDATLPSDLTNPREVRSANPCDKDLQRADGLGRIVLADAEKGARIVEAFQRFPIRIMFPRAVGGAIEEAVFVNTAGGIASGDRLNSCVTALADASIAVTSQA